MRVTPAILAVALTVFAACTERSPAPTDVISAARSGVPFEAGLASPAWQAKTASLIATANTAPVNAARLYAFVGVAQYLAVQRAEGTSGGGRDQLEADRGAVAGASAVVLSFLFPTKVAELEAIVEAQSNAGPGQPHPAFAKGEAIGRAVGAEIVAYSQTDGFNAPFSFTIPVGPGLWTSNTTPPTLAGGPAAVTRPWFLTSQNQFRPGAPPAFGSTDFNTARDEVRHISDTRTPEQTAIAAFWALNAGTPTAPGFWLQVATDNIISHGLSEREATHVYALTSATMWDAVIGCWEAKEFYWVIRPWQTDPLITTTAAVGKPNHPSYPSGHSCVSSSGAEVISTVFPEQRAQLEAMVTQAGLSRVYGGIHYQFDITAGQALGRNVAHFAIAADASGNSVLTPH